MTMTSSEGPTNAVPLRLFFKRDDPGFSVLEARGRFAMSELWEVELLAQLADPAFAPSEVKGRGARLALLEEPGAPVLCGVIAAIAQVYRARLRG